MAVTAKTTRQRVSAEERRDALIAAAIDEFSHGGFHGTPVDVIARRVGVKQPYVFSLFGTKRELFIAAVERGFQIVCELFTDVATAWKPDPANPDATLLKALGESYIELLKTDSTVLALQLHAYAACGDDEVIREHVRAAYRQLEDHVRALAGMSEEKLNTFLSIGMWLNVQAAIDPANLDGACDWIAANGPHLVG